MADKQISDLTAATAVQAADLFVLEQSRTAKKLSGQVLINWLTSYADGHGGIQNISVTDSGTSGNGALHTITVTMADETTAVFTVRDGYKGNTGNSWYLWIKYSADLPTSNADMSDIPDNYIGIYSGTATSAPTNYTSYVWFKWKGETGNTGLPCEIVNQSVTYLVSTSGTVVPEGSWTTTIPTVPSGYYLWTRTRWTFNDETVTTAYSVSRNGIDGSGAVSSVNNLSPEPNGNVELTASNIPTSDNTSVQQHIADAESAISELQTYEIRHITGQLTALPASFSYSFITTAHRIINAEFGTPSAIASDLTWTTSAGDVTFSGTLNGSTTIDFDIVKVVTP